MQPSRSYRGAASWRRWLAIILLCRFGIGTASAQAPDVVVLCDPSLQQALVAAGRAWQAKTQVPVRVLTASFEQNMHLIVQGARADILVGIGAERIDQAQQFGALSRGSPTVIGHDPIVLIAKMRAPQVRQLRPGDTLDALLGQDRIGLVDSSFGSAAADARASLGGVGLWPELEKRSAGAVTTAGLKFLLDAGSIRLAALYKTDLADEPSFYVVATFTAPWPIVVAELAKDPQSPRAKDFLSFLAHDGQTVLQQNGMEPP